MKTPTKTISLPERLTQCLRLPVWKRSISALLLAQFGLWSVQVNGANLIWDADGTAGGVTGGTGNWDTAALLWNNGGTMTAWNNALFSTAVLGGTGGALNLDAGGISAGGITIQSNGYTLSGGPLTLGSLVAGQSPVISIGEGNFLTNTGMRSVISSDVLGTQGLTKTGNGTLVLSGAANTYTGATVIRGGSLSISNASQLGNSTGTIGVFGINALGFLGGSLQVQGGSVNAPGLTFTRELSLSGRGVNATGTGALTSIGNNTFTGDILTSSITEARLLSIAGTTTLAGRLSVGPATGNQAYLYGPGNYVISGQIVGGTSGTSTIVKGSNSIVSTLELTNNNNTMLGGVRAEGGFVRVSNGAQLGLGNNITSGSGGNINFNGGTFEIRSDNPASFATRNISYEFGGGTLFADHAVGTLGAAGLNQTFTFANLRQENNRVYTFTGRNGTNIAIAAVNNTASGNASDGFTNNGSGSLVVNGDVWNEADGTARTYTVTSTGEMTLNGSILAPSTVQHTFTKAGSGTFTLNGNSGSFIGSATLSAGTLNINNIGALNSTGIGRVVFGGGTLNYTGAGQTWSKVLLMNATNNILTNNGSGALVIQSNVINNGTGAKTLFLGGSNGSTNDLQGIVTNTTVGAGVTKIDNGVWQISSPGTTSATIGTSNAAFGITAVGGTASSTITTTSTTGLVVGQPIYGTGVPIGTVISQIISSTQFATSQNLTNTGSSVFLGTVTGNTSTLAVSGNAANVLTVPSTNGLVVGQPISGPGMAAGSGWFISAINSATTFTVANTTGAAALANSVAVGNQTPGLSPNFAGPLTIAGGSVILNPLTSTAEVINNSSNVVFATDAIRGSQYAGGSLTYKGHADGSTEVAGILTPTAGAGRILVTPGTSGTTTLSFGSLGARTAGATLSFAPGVGTGIQFAAVPTGLNGQIGGYAYMTDPATGVNDFVATPVANTNIAILGSATTLPTSGSLSTANYVIPTATSVTLAGATPFTTLRIEGSGQTLDQATFGMTITNTTATAIGGILLDNRNGGATISGGNIAGSVAANELIFTVAGSTAAANALSVSSTIGAGAASAVTKAGPGMMIVSGNNSFTGALTINEGTLRTTGTAARLGNPAAGTVYTIRQLGTLDIGGAGDNLLPAYTGGTVMPILAVAPVNGSGTITTSATGLQAISFGTSGSTGSGVFSSVIANGSGTIAVIRNGTSGTQALTGLNTYTGPTILSGGATLLVNSLANGGSPSAIGASTSDAANLVFNGGTLVYSGSNATVYQTTQTPSVSTNRRFTLAGNGRIDSSGQFGNNVIAGGAANNAALIFSSTDPVSYAGATTARTLTLGGNSTGDNQFSPRLIDNGAGALGLTKVDAGLWILTPATSNNYTGTTTISGGALQVAPEGAAVQGLSATSLLTLSGGVLQTSGNFTRTLGATAGNVQLTGGASGFAASTAPLTVTLGGGDITWGGATFNPSALTLNSTSALSTVNFTNNLNLNAGSRTITVNDNGSTATDNAILSGLISGTGASNLTKNGAGVLYITGANTYNGNTAIQEGAVAVTSIGSGGSSSNFGNATGSLTLGNAGGNAVVLLYYGPGESVTRSVIWNSTTGTGTIDSSGSGPITLSNFTQTGNGNKALTLRGFNTDANTISSIIGNAGGGVTSLTKTDGGTWILAGNNTYTGTTTVSSGWLGIGGTAGGTTNNPLPGALTLGGNFVSAGIFATNSAGLAISSAVSLIHSQNISFGGVNSITLNGALSATTGGDPTITNVMSGGTLTINSNFTNPEGSTTANTPRTLNIRGTGNTIWNGAINNNVAGTRTHTQALNISIAPDASFTIGGTPTFSATPSTGTVTLSQGRLILSRLTNVFSGDNTQIFAFNGGSLSSTNALTGANAIVNPIQINGTPVVVNGSNSLQFGSATALTFGASRSLINDLTGGATLTISSNIAPSATSTLSIIGAGPTVISGAYQAGTGTNALQMLGTGTLSLTGNNAYTGATTLSSGTTTLSGDGRLGATSVTTINHGAILNLNNSVANPTVADRLGNRPLAINGGTLNFTGLAAGSTEGTAGSTLTFANGQGTINITNNGGTTQMNFTTLTANTGGAANFTSNVPIGTATNRVIFSTAPTLSPVTTGILSRITIEGADFATYGANGLAAYTAYNNTGAYTDINASAATDTIKVGSGFVTTDDITSSRTINALAIAGTGLNVSGAANSILTLTSGGVLVTGGSNTLSAPRINLGAEGAFQIGASASLNVTGALVGAAGMNKNLTGGLTLSTPTFVIGTTTVNNGSLDLGSSLNTMFPRQALAVNGSGIVNLNDGVQLVSTLSGGTNPGSGGTINLGEGILAAAMAGNATFAGNITGTVDSSFVRLGGSTLTLESPLTFSGLTSLNGGTTSLRDNATILNSSGIDLNYATLVFDNNANMQTDIADRVGNGIPISLRGSVLTYNGRALVNSTETLGALSLLEGASTVTSAPGGSGSFNSSTLTFASLTRSAGSTLNFTGSNLGQVGNNGFINFTTPPTLVGDQLLGNWAIVNSGDYAAYNATQGVGAVGSGGFTQYDWQEVSGADAAPVSGTFAAGNVTNIHAQAIGSLKLPLGNTTTGMLRLSGAFQNDINFTSETDVLHLSLGGLLRSNNNNTTNIGSVAARGVITSGTSELIVYNSANTTGATAMTINSVIQGTGTKFIKSGGGVLALTAQNTYTGGTIVNQGVLELRGTNANDVVIPAGGLTINGATVTMFTNNNQIAATNTVTLNDSATLTMVGNNTLESLAFVNTGGSTNPTVTTNGILTLNATTPITVSSKNPSTVATIAGNLNLGSGARTINTPAITFDSKVLTEITPALNISAAIVSLGTSLTKTGAGLLQLSGASTFNGGVSVSAGGLVLGTSSTGTTPNALVSGPVGIGTLSMASGSILLADDSSRTIANAVNFAGNPIFGNTGGSLDTLTLNGDLSFATQTTAGVVVNVNTPYLNVVLGGRIANIGTLTSVGSGSGANTITKTGLGNVTGINLNGLGSTVPINPAGLTSANSFALLHDGDGTSSVETINLGTVTFNPLDGGNLALTIGRAGSDVNYATAAFKTISLAGLTSTVLPNGLTLTNNNGYGLAIPDAIALSSTSSWSVSTVNNSIQPVGLTLSGVLSGNGFAKAGDGVLRLTNASNSFTGTINVTNGTVEGASDAVFGALANIIQLGSNSATEGLRISGSFATDRTIHLNAASSGIDVTEGNTFTLNNPFTFATATNSLQKNDLGTLVLTDPQTGWDGNLLISQGVVKVNNADSLGSTTGNVQINAAIGGALEISGSINILDAIAITSGENVTSSGVNAGGAIRSTAGTNTLTGAVSWTGTSGTNDRNRSIFLAADSGSTLNINGGLSTSLTTGQTNRDAWVALGGAGTINLNSAVTVGSAAGGGSTLSFVKSGTGTLNVSQASFFTGQNIIVKQGTMTLNGAATMGAATNPAATAGTVFINNTAILSLDNSTTNTNNRLNNRNLNMQGANFQILGNSAAPTVETTTGTFTLNSGKSYITLDADLDQPLSLTTGAVTRNAGSTLVIRGDGFGSASANGVGTISATGTAYAFAGQLGATNATNKSILPYALGDTSLSGTGLNFVTADSADAGANSGANILRLLNSNEQVANFATANANVNLTSTQTLSTLTTINSLRLASGGGVILNYVPLTLDSGGLLALSGNTGITGNSGVSYLTTGANRELIIHNESNMVLDIPIAGTTGALTKSGAGSLTLAAGNSNHGTIYVNEGTLILGGGNQTILPGRAIQLNNGGTLDLNGTVQNFGFLQTQVGGLARNDQPPDTIGGNIINSAGTLPAQQALLSMRSTGSSNYIGAIQGNIAVAYAVSSGDTRDLNLYTPQTYTGPTLVNGGRVQLTDAGALIGTTSIEVSNATLNIGASNTSTEVANTTNRVNDAATILLRGSMLQLRNRAAVMASETLGALTVGQGTTMIDFNEGGTGVNRTDVTLSSFSRVANQHAMVRFVNVDANLSSALRLFVTTLNGASTATVGGGLTNNLIGGWAIFDRDFASYIPGQGVGALNTQGFAGYSPNLINAGTSTDNIRIALPAAGSTTTLTGNRTINSLAVIDPGSATASSTIDLGGFTLTLGSGGLILSPVTDNQSMSLVNGTLTAGTTNAAAELFLHGLTWTNNQGDNTGNRDINLGATITNNTAGGVVSLVVGGSQGRGSAAATNDIFITGNNTYTGGTWVNSGRVVLNNPNADGTTVSPIGTGNLTIAGGYGSNPGIYSDRNTQVFLGAPDQILHSASVTLMGGGTLNLNNFNQTLAGLTFDNHGGDSPTVTTGTGTLTLSGSTITASGQNAGSSSTIAGKLALGSATTTLSVAEVLWNSKVLNPYHPNLLISASIEGQNLVKTGSGVLSLTGANAYTGSFDLQAGGLQLGNNNALSAGALIIGNNTFLTSTADARVIANPYTVSGNFALSDANNLTLSGPGTLTDGNHNISVDLAAKILTLSGVLDDGANTANITKIGNGILVLSNGNNTYGGTTTVSDGILRYGAVNAVPTGSAMTISTGGILDVTLGGTAVTLGSLASNSASTGGVLLHGAVTGTNTLTVGGDNSTTAFGGVISNGTGSTLNFVKTGSGVMTLGGANTYNGSTTVANGRLVAQPVGGNSPLGTSQSLVLGGGTTAGILQLGNGTGALSHTFTSLSSAGSATTNQIVSGSATAATLTLNLATTSTFAGNIGGAGTNEGNLSLVKSGVGDLSITGTGTSTYNGSTTVNGGKLFMDRAGAFSTSTSGLTLADGTEFALRGTTLDTITSYGFSGGAGTKIVVGSSLGAALGFGIDGTGNSQLVLTAGQAMQVNGTLTTSIYVNNAPVDGQKYVLIDGASAGSLNGLGGTFNTSPVVFNGGSFTYALSFDSGVNGGGLQQWVLTPTAQPALADVWWRGDLTGLAQGVWSATLTSGTGFPSNWDNIQASATAVDAQVPPDKDSIVHFSSDAAANLTTTLGANMTIQELIFHTGNAATSIGSSNGTNTLTLGNATDASGLTIETGAGNVGISAIVGLAKDQSWNIHDTARVLTLSGGLIGTNRSLTVNDLTTNSGTLLFSGNAAAMTGTLNMNAGVLAFEGTGSLNSGLNVVLGTAAKNATLTVGGATSATNAILGGLSNGSFAGSRVIGGNATMSTLTIGSTTGSHTYSGALGGIGTNENQFNLVKAGAGTQILNGTAITYAGTTTVREGTLQLGSAAVFAPTGSLSILANPGATAVFDFNGKNYTTVGTLTLGGGASGLAQIIDSNVTKGLLTLGGDVVYDAANNPGAATISSNLSTGARTFTVANSTNATTELTLGGTIAASGNLTFAGAGSGTINGAITMTGTNLQVNYNSTGTWTINAATNTTGTGDWNINSGVVNANATNALNAADDIVITGTGVQGSAIVNIGGSVGATGIHQGDNIFIRGGGLVNVSVANGISTGTNQLLIGDSGSASAAAAGVLNFSSNVSIATTAGLQLGATGGQLGYITGTGTFTSAGTKTLSNGGIEAGVILAGNGAITKNTTGVVTFSGERAAASTGNTTISEGNLILDYTTNNNSKIGAVLSIGTINTEAILTLNGNAAANTSQSVTSTTLAAGNNVIAINNGASRTATLNLGAITRTAANAGLLTFEYLSSSSKATSTSPAGTLGYATVIIAGGVERFAAINGSADIVQAAQTTANDVTTWLPGQDIINDAAYTGTISGTTIDSLTFNASVASTVNIAATGYLAITSGGIMVDPAVAAFTSTINGGTIVGASNSGIAGELIIHQNNSVGSLVIGSRIINSGGITKTGAGTLSLNGSNTFLSSGSQIMLDQGTLQVQNGNAIGDNTSVYMRANTILALANSNETIGNLTTPGTNNFITLGTGDLTINQTANNTYSGLITGGAGSLLVYNGLNTNFNITGSTTSGFTGTVVVNAGLLQLSGSAGRLSGVTAFTINKTGTFLIDNNDDSAPSDRIDNAASFTLNSADGSFQGTTIVRGLAIRTDNNATHSESIGALTFASGSNYASLENSGGTASIAFINATNFTRSLNSTLTVRGRGLGATANAQNRLRISDTTNQTAFIASTNLVGGAGAIDTTDKNIKIVPWVVGQNLAANLADTDMGNTLVTYVTDRGFVPLDLANNYNTFAAAGTEDNTRESLAADLTALAGKTVNSLVLHRNITTAGNTNVTGAGAANALTNTSGAFLFTLATTATASTAHSITLGGFDDGIKVGANNEYIFHVVNPSSAATTATLTARVTSPLNTTAATLTKSGRGTLELGTDATTGLLVNTYTGGTTVNEGTLLIHDNDNIGGTGAGTQGDLNLAGGTLRLASDYSDDLGSRDLAVRAGGGTIQVDAATVTATNLVTTGAGNLIKTGTGTLQIAGGTANTHTGIFAVNQGLVELNKTVNVNAVSGSLLTIGGAGSNATVRLLASNQIANTTSVTVASTGTTAMGILDLNNNAETISALTMNNTTVQGTLITTGASGVLTVTGDITLNSNRSGNDTSSNARNIVITGTGNITTAAPNTGTLNLGGATRIITVQTTTTGANLGNSDATIETAITNGGVIKEGSRALILSGNNTYTGGTTINNGEINLRGGSLAAGSVVVSKAGGSLTDAAVLSGTGTIGGAVSLGETNTGVGILSLGSRTSTTTLISNYGAGVNGSLSLTAAGTGLSVANGSQVQMDITAASITINSVGTNTGAFASGLYSSYANFADYLTQTSTANLFNVAPVGSNQDYLSVSGSVTLGTGTAGGVIRVSSNGYNLATAKAGDLFNLIDWASMSGDFTGTGGFSAGGQIGDLFLPTLTNGTLWDTSAFATHGIVVVVPEPGRALLMLLGLMALFFRRRRQD